jgi:HNH endonuclease
MKQPPYDHPCECGCGRMARWRFLPGHNSQFIKRKRKSPVDYLVQDRGYKTPCWIWQQATSSQGYGMVTIKNKQFLMHRVMYEQVYGAIPEGLELDHLCRNRPCVRPDHLEAVTHAVNTRRGPQTKLTEEIAAEIRRRVAAGENRQALAAEVGIDYTIICDIVNDRIWRPS